VVPPEWEFPWNFVSFISLSEPQDEYAIPKLSKFTIWPNGHSRAIFFKLKKQRAQFLNRIDTLHTKHKKKTKKCVGLASYDTLRGWRKSCFLQKVMVGFMPPASMTLPLGPKNYDEIFSWIP
jgi:hypothetical protein